MQVETLQKNIEQERRALRLKVSQLEKKLEEVTENLASTQAALSAKEAELSVLQNNLKELEELREMKEVIIFCLFLLIIFRQILLSCIFVHLGKFCFLTIHYITNLKVPKTICWALFILKDIDRKNEQTAAILKMQGAQLAEMESLYKEEQVLRKRYFNMIEGMFHIFCH